MSVAVRTTVTTVTTKTTMTGTLPDLRSFVFYLDLASVSISRSNPLVPDASLCCCRPPSRRRHPQCRPSSASGSLAASSETALRAPRNRSDTYEPLDYLTGGMCTVKISSGPVKTGQVSRVPTHCPWSLRCICLLDETISGIFQVSRVGPPANYARARQRFRS